jgi:phosphohistidine swiveling domain-containing protein
MSRDKLLKKAKDIKWEFWVDRPYPPFISTLLFAGHGKEYSDRVKLYGFGNPALLYQLPFVYYPKKSFENNLKNLEKYFKSSSIFTISRLLAELHKKNKQEILLLVKDKKMDPIIKLDRVGEVLRTYCPFLWITRVLEAYYEKKMLEHVPKYIKKDLQKFIAEASTPNKVKVYGKMIKMLESGVEVEKVHKKFAWMKSRDGFTDFYTPLELVEIRKHIKKENAQQKNSSVIPKPLKELFSEVKELVFLRTDRTDKYYESMALVRPIFEEVANCMKVSFKDLAGYDARSIVSGKFESFSGPYSYLYIGKNEIVQNEPVVSSLLNFGKEEEINGKIAFNGLVRGRVKIVKHPSEIEKVKKGNILVCQMTFPSFIGAMQKAAAFVTDEGGLTCHAAIIARELKKPCIIGTKVATQILKDGDLVEVDANNGVVKIIKS